MQELEKLFQDWEPAGENHFRVESVYVKMMSSFTQKSKRKSFSCFMSHVGIIFRVRYTFLLRLIQCVNGIKSTGTVSHRGKIETWASPTATIFSHLVFLAVAPNRLVWHKKCEKISHTCIRNPTIRTYVLKEELHLFYLKYECHRMNIFVHLQGLIRSGKINPDPTGSGSTAHMLSTVCFFRTGWWPLSRCRSTSPAWRGRWSPPTRLPRLWRARAAQAGFRIRIDLMRIRMRIRIQHFF